jgi:uncharacterized protein
MEEIRMASLYVTSSEAYSGKSAVCLGVGIKFGGEGLKIGYLKPVNTHCEVRDGVAHDDDLEFARTQLSLVEPVESLGPIALTPDKLELVLRGPDVDYAPKLRSAIAQASAGRDLLVLEGGRTLLEGYAIGLPSRSVVEIAGATVLLVLRHDETLMIDRALSAQDYFGQRLGGAVINQVPRTAQDHVRNVIVPYLRRCGVPVFGSLPKDPVLLAPSVAEMAEELKANVLCCPERLEEGIQDVLVGAMSVDAALTYFRRRPNKAVITGGDRADIQLAALETSTRCLILTGNLPPRPMVLSRAEELGVPVLLVNMDTLGTIGVVERLMGRNRFQQPQKIARFLGLMGEHFDYDALRQILELRTAL